MDKKAHWAGIGFAVIFGFTFLASKTALRFVSPAGLVGYRFLVAFVAFEGLRRVGVFKVRFLPGAWKAWLPAALCEPVLYFFFETYGLQRTSSGEAGMMLALIPILVALLGMAFLKEPPRLFQILAILLSIGGIVVIQTGRAGDAVPGETLGFALLFGAVLCAAFFAILSRKAAAILTPTEITYFMMMTAAVVFNAVYLVELATGAGIATYFQAFAHLEILVPLLYLGIVASIGGFFLINYALSRLPAHVSSIYSNLSTVVAVAAGALVLGERLDWYHFVGAAMIVAGVYGTVAAGRRAPRKGVNA